MCKAPFGGSCWIWTSKKNRFWWSSVKRRFVNMLINLSYMLPVADGNVKYPLYFHEQVFILIEGFLHLAMSSAPLGMRKSVKKACMFLTEIVNWLDFYRSDLFSVDSCVSKLNWWHWDDQEMTWFQSICKFIVISSFLNYLIYTNMKTLKLRKSEEFPPKILWSLCLIEFIIYQMFL